MLNRLTEVWTSLETLTVYRGLLQDKVIGKLYSLALCAQDRSVDFNRFIRSYSEFYYAFLECNSVHSFKYHVINLIVYEDNAFGRHCEKVGSDALDGSLLKAVQHDLMCLEKAASITAAEIKEEAIENWKDSSFEIGVLKRLPEWDFNNNETNRHGLWEFFSSCSCWSECIGRLADFHRRIGSGQFARYKGFVWEHRGEKGCLQGVQSLDPIRLSDMIGYETERREVIENTLQFLKGYPANNILLYGDRGTGKSSTVKALLNEFYDKGLRMIEIPKMFLGDFPEIIRLIKDRKQKFILFVDDLAFEDSEESYVALKAVLEGGLETRPRNVVIYATSNRRHLIKEKFSDRKGLTSVDREDEVRAADTLQEKLSLADRFGITVTFSSPDQARYLEIVDGLAESRGLKVDPETLHREALKWELWYNGRSPRTARQFIDWMEGQVADSK